MRKSKASSAESSSSTPASSSSVPNSSSKNIGGEQSTGSTTATIDNTKSTTTTTITTTRSSGGSGGGGSECVINGTRGGSSSISNNENNSSVQSAVKPQQRPPLDRQFDVVTAPLATFDTVDLSDEELTPTKATSPTTTTPPTPTATTTNSPSSANNNNISEQKTTTTTTTPPTPTATTTNSPSSANNNNISEQKTTTTTTTNATAATTTTAAKTSEIKPTHIITNPTSCSNGSNVSAPLLKNTATNNTNSATITTTPALTSGKKSNVTCKVTTSGVTIPATTKPSENCERNSSSSGGEKNRARLDQVGATSIAKTKKNSIPVQPNQESIGARSHLDGVKDSAVTLKQTRVTDPHATHTSSSDDEGGVTSSHVSTDLLSASPNKCKPVSVSVESTRPTTGEGSLALPTAAGATAVVGATAGSATSNVDFANFGSTEDLNSNNIGGSQSTTVDGGGLAAAPAATGGGAGSKPKEISTVEKTSLLDESSSSDSDLSPTEPGPAGGAYTTLKSGSTPNLIRKVSHDATSAIKENSGQRVDFNSPELIASSSKRKAYERRLQRLQVKTTPINRPRSTTPLSVVTLDEYTNLSSPEISPNLEKLKIVLPSDQFGRPIKSPRSKENAFDFNEDRLFRHTKEAIVLQSDGSIGQSPRRILIPPTLSPSQSPCKAAAGSPVSKLVLVSRLPAGTSPLVKSATPSLPPPPGPHPPGPSLPSSSFSSSSSTSAAPAWKTSEKKWEQFDEFHSKAPQLQQQQPQGTCAIPKRSELPVGLPNFEKKQGSSKTGHPELSSSKGLKEQEKKKKKVLTGEEISTTKSTTFDQHTDSRRNTTTSTLNPSHHKVQMNCPEEEEEILKVEIGSSDVGKAYNIELEVPAKERLDSSHSKPSS